jgi:hypothetical protein
MEIRCRTECVFFSWVGHWPMNTSAEVTNLFVQEQLSSRPERSEAKRSAIFFLALEISVHDPAAVDVEGLTGHRIA